jgi:hypothetical protein
MKNAGPWSAVGCGGLVLGLGAAVWGIRRLRQGAGPP